MIMHYLVLWCIYRMVERDQRKDAMVNRGLLRSNPVKLVALLPIIFLAYGCETVPVGPTYEYSVIDEVQPRSDGVEEDDGMDAAGTAGDNEEDDPATFRKKATREWASEASNGAGSSESQTRSRGYGSGGTTGNYRRAPDSAGRSAASAAAGNKVKATIVDGRLVILKGDPPPSPAIRPSAPAPAPSGPGVRVRDVGRYAEVVLNPAATRIMIATMLADWGETSFTVDDELVRHVSYFLKYLALYDRGATSRALRRSGSYLPYIRSQFGKYGLHEDLAFAVPFVESKFTEGAQSSAGAVGMFQFLAPTARDYGVAVSPDDPEDTAPRIDERLDWQKTAVAAAQYLSRHRKEFKSVLLALGAYHHGGERVERVLASIGDKGRDRAFRPIFSSPELGPFSREYIPMCLAAACVYRLTRQGSETILPDARIECASIKTPVPLAGLSAQYKDVLANNPDLSFTDKVYCYASTGGYLLITQLNFPGRAVPVAYR